MYHCGNLVQEKYWKIFYTQQRLGDSQMLFWKYLRLLSEKDIYYLLTTPTENVSCYTLNFCGYHAQRNLQARWQNKHNKNVFSFLLKWIPRTIHWYNMGHFTGLGSGFTLASVNPLLWIGLHPRSILPKIALCRDGCLNQLRKTASLLLTYTVNPIFHWQIITLRSFINITVSSYSLFHLTTEANLIFSKLTHLLPYCNESQTTLFTQYLWDYIISLKQAFPTMSLVPSNAGKEMKRRQWLIL